MNDAVKETRKVTFAGMAVNIIIAIMKGIGGVVWSSHALIADAVHSISDLATDLAVAFGVKYWEAPADEEHPYGHGKIQALVSLFIAVMLAIVAYELGKKAVLSFLITEHTRPDITAFIIALISIVAKEWLYHWTIRVSREIKSPALKANAWHHRSDALSSIPVAIAIALAYFFPALWWADAVGALIVAVFILYVVWEIASQALQELTDADIDDKAIEVTKIATQVQGVLDVHQCRARRYGGAFQADLHIHVDPALSIVEAHKLGHEVKDAIIGAQIGITDAVIHVEPASAGKMQTNLDGHASA